MGMLHVTWLLCSNKPFHTAKKIWGRGNGEVIKIIYQLPLSHFSHSPFPLIPPFPHEFEFLFATVLSTSRSWNRFFNKEIIFFLSHISGSTPPIPQTLSAQKAPHMKEFYTNKPSIFWSWNLNCVYCLRKDCMFWDN